MDASTKGHAHASVQPVQLAQNVQPTQPTQSTQLNQNVRNGNTNTSTVNHNGSNNTGANHTNSHSGINTNWRDNANGHINRTSMTNGYMARNPNCTVNQASAITQPSTHTRVHANAPQTSYANAPMGHFSFPSSAPHQTFNQAPTYGSPASATDAPHGVTHTPPRATRPDDTPDATPRSRILTPHRAGTNTRPVPSLTEAELPSPSDALNGVIRPTAVPNRPAATLRPTVGADAPRRITPAKTGTPSSLSATPPPAYGLHVRPTELPTATRTSTATPTSNALALNTITADTPTTAPTNPSPITDSLTLNALTLDNTPRPPPTTLPAPTGTPRPITHLHPTPNPVPHPPTLPNFHTGGEVWTACAPGLAWYFNLGPSPAETCKIIVDRHTGRVCAHPADVARGARNMCPGHLSRLQAEVWGVAHHD